MPKQNEMGAPITEVCRKLGESDATLCNWRKKFGGLGPSKLKHPEEARGIPQSTFRAPGKPTDNAMVESLSGRLREECLNANWFLSLIDA